MCNCKNMVRTPDEKQGFPMSEHHPNCEDYEVLEFVRVTNAEDGNSFIEQKDIAVGLVNEGGWQDYKITESVFLTKDQFENLPEYLP